MIAEVEVNNVSGFGIDDPWVVVRFSPESRSFWYYGRYANKDLAESVAKEIRGMVIKEID